MSGGDGGYALGVDLGTSNTVAVLRWPDGRTRPLLFDGQPIMPSGVFLDATGRLHVGRDAQRLAQADPAGYEPNPKRRIDDATVLLRDREVPTVDLLAAVLGAVARAAVEAVGFLPPAVVTHPAAWGVRRRGVLTAAIARAGWPAVDGDRGTRLVPEPVAAARYFAEVLRRPVPVGAALTVFDFGGGTLDIAVVRNTGTGFEVVGSGGVAELGGLDLDAALVEQLGATVGAVHPQAWRALTQPAGPAQWRDRRQFWEDVRGAKELLSRASVAPVPVPGVDQAAHLTREELERLATPLLQRGVRATASVIADCGLTPDQLAGLFLVGGSSRIPLVARLLHAELGVAPTVLEQPELPVAEGALLDAAVAVPAPVAVSAGPAAAPAGFGPSGSGVPPPPLGSGASGPGVPPSVAPPGAPIGTAGPVPPHSATPVHPMPSSSAAPVPPVGARPARPWYQHRLLWGAAAVVVLLGVVLASTLYLTRRGYDKIDFESSVTQLFRVQVGDGEQPSDFYTRIVDGHAYLAYERADDRLEVIAIDPPTNRERWRIQTTSTSGDWAGIEAHPKAVVAYQDRTLDSEYRDLIVLDPASGAERWRRPIKGNDGTLFTKDLLVLVDRTENRLLGLDLRDGTMRWELDTPANADNSTATSVHVVRTVEDLSGPTYVDGAPFARWMKDDQRIVQILADRSARVIDAATGTVLNSGANVASTDDWVLAYRDWLVVATSDDQGGYRLSRYDLAKLDQPTHLYTARDPKRALRLVAVCGEARVCVLDEADAEAETRQIVSIDLAKGGKIWGPKEVPHGRIVIHFGDQVAVRSLDGEYRSRVFAEDGKQLLERDGAIGRIDGGNMLFFESASDSVDHYTVAGLHAGEDRAIELGQLRDVRSSTCSWDAKYIVCGGDDDFLVARFARE